MTPTPADDLLTKIEKIRTLLRRVDQLRALPADRVREVKRLEIKTDYYGNRMSDYQEAAAMCAMAHMERIAAESAALDRDAGLREIARELEQERVLLPSMAAKLCIDLGVVARDLAKEAG